ncbi:hypothetical protein [Bradyrhizobium sp. DASA03120]|uniref:hypothetical protein n=1 Tax=Bradyrhizobium sp. SMVTL-02 TaxID=3395917 RepID=UPI003F717902
MTKERLTQDATRVFLLPPAIFIATCLTVASPSVAQQVRVITGDTEHIYGPGGEVLDDAELRARNERALERAQLEKRRAIEKQQIEAENERLRLQREQAALAYATYPAWDSTYGGWFFVDRRHRGHGRMGVSPRMGSPRR